MPWLGLSQTATAFLLTAIWQGVLLSAATWVGLRFIPRTPAAVRFSIWFAVFAVVAALPVISLWTNSAGAAQTSSHGAWLTLDPRWSLALAALWALASLGRAVQLAVAALRVRALWQRATPLSNGPCLTAGLRTAELCVSDEVDRPSVIGFFSPRILIPRWLLEKLTPSELRQVVLHESSHLHRADDWLNLLQKVALVVFPLNPALLWVERRLCFERELACDERVLNQTRAPKAYAACLAALAEHRIARRGLALGLALGLFGSLGRQSELGRRVRRILARTETLGATATRAVLASAAVVLVAGVAVLARCPQLVGFAAVPTPDTTAAAGSQPIHARPANYSAQQVVFHPAANPARATSQWQPSASRPIVQKRRQKALQDPEQQRQTAQWFLVTSWETPDGTHLVLTAAHSATGDPAQPELRVPARFHVVPATQVHPYAAVPTRDGWLVFQL
jgi:beta-lactamase regulating signal transducer with metallopeptidase domain